MHIPVHLKLKSEFIVCFVCFLFFMRHPSILHKQNETISQTLLVAIVTNKYSVIWLDICSNKNNLSSNKNKGTHERTLINRHSHPSVRHKNFNITSIEEIPPSAKCGCSSWCLVKLWQAPTNLCVLSPWYSILTSVTQSPGRQRNFSEQELCFCLRRYKSRATKERVLPPYHGSNMTL